MVLKELLSLANLFNAEAHGIYKMIEVIMISLNQHLILVAI